MEQMMYFASRRYQTAFQVILAVLAVLLSVFPLVPANAGQCLRNIRDVKLSGGSAPLREYRCRLDGDPAASLRVEFQRLNEMAAGVLLMGGSAPWFDRLYGKHRVVDNDVLQEYRMLIQQFGTPTRWRPANDEMGPSLSLHSLADQNSEAFQSGEAAGSASREVRSFQLARLPDFPLADELSSILNEKGWPQSFKMYYATSEHKSGVSPVENMTVWFNLSRDHADKYLFNFQKYMKAATGKKPQQSKDDIKGINLLKYITDTAWPAEFMITDASIQLTEGCETGYFIPLHFQTPQYDFEVDIAIVENNAPKPVEINQFLGASDRSNQLRQLSDDALGGMGTAAPQALPGTSQTLHPKERLIIPLRLRLKSQGVRGPELPEEKQNSELRYRQIQATPAGTIFKIELAVENYGKEAKSRKPAKVMVRKVRESFKPPEYPVAHDYAFGPQWTLTGYTIGGERTVLEGAEGRLLPHPVCMERGAPRLGAPGQNHPSRLTPGPAGNAIPSLRRLGAPLPYRRGGTGGLLHRCRACRDRAGQRRSPDAAAGGQPARPRGWQFSADRCRRKYGIEVCSAGGRTAGKCARNPACCDGVLRTVFNDVALAPQPAEIAWRPSAGVMRSWCGSRQSMGAASGGVRLHRGGEASSQKHPPSTRSQRIMQATRKPHAQIIPALSQTNPSPAVPRLPERDEMSAQSSIASRLAFHGLDRETIAILREHKDFILSVMPGILDKFYEHAAKFDDTARHFRGREHMGQAKQAQLRHWAIIAEGRFDENYAASVTKIGETHNRLGLTTRWYIGGYSQLVSLLVEAVALHMPSGMLNRGAERKAKLQGALVKASLLDMDYVIATYIDANRRDYNALLERVAGEFERGFGGVFTALNSTAGALRKTSETLTSTAQGASSRANSVAAAAEQASANVQTVASAAEQLSSSVREIGDQVDRSKNISQQALENAEMTSAKVAQLMEATQKIGDVVSLINNIARQTNLLALNATIEAARAGEMGKGFAVVAQEVKVLADQTASATGDISVQIEHVQNSTSEAVTAIRRIGEIIHAMTDISTTVASAVEEQGLATQEIARSVNEAAIGTREVSSNIFSVSQATTDTGHASKEVLTESENLTGQAEQVRVEVNRFLTAIRAKIAEGESHAA
jgi:methyl-accepting chemotaxis protein